MPSWLGLHGKAEWKRMVPILSSVGCFSESDLTAFAQMCGALDRFHKARLHVAKHGQVTQGKRGLVMNPSIRIQQEAAALILRCCGMFGMSPADRVGMMGVPRDDGRDDLERFKSETA